MATALRRCAMLLVLFGLAVGPAFSQETPPADAFGFKMALGIGVQTFNEPDSNTGSPTTTYQSLSLSPDISFGKFGVGLAITLNYRFTGTGSSFEVRKEDWVPHDFQNFLEIYLPKIAYIRWGVKGDPLFLELGSFTNATLGDGFIVGEYNNMLFMPGERHFGLMADLDGKLFEFPFVGFESIIGNVAQLDVLGGRVYLRPLVTTDLPLLSNLEVGFTAAVDREPFFNTVSPGSPNPISVFGGDVRIPIVYVKDVVSMLAYTDVATIQAKSWGGMIGVGGRLINIFTYGLQFRALGEDFIPTYFGPTYDLLRDHQYTIIHTGGFSDAMLGWQASVGTSLLGDTLIFRISLDGPFGATASTDPLLRYPHLRGIFTLAEGVVPGITFDFSYDKKALASFDDLIDAENAAIQAQVNFKTGPAVISFVYKIVYDPSKLPDDPWNVTSGLQSSIALF
jgi:hypothetical protein